jgi:hypothetical protein
MISDLPQSAITINVHASPFLMPDIATSITDGLIKNSREYAKPTFLNKKREKVKRIKNDTIRSEAAESPVIPCKKRINSFHNTSCVKNCIAVDSSYNSIREVSVAT